MGGNARLAADFVADLADGFGVDLWVGYGLVAEAPAVGNRGYTNDVRLRGRRWYLGMENHWVKSSTHGGGFCLCRRGLNRRVIVNQTEFKGPGDWKKPGFLSNFRIVTKTLAKTRFLATNPRLSRINNQRAIAFLCYYHDRGLFSYLF